MTRQLRVLLRRSSAASGGPLVKNEKRVKVSASSMAEVEAALAATFRSTVQGRPISVLWNSPAMPWCRSCAPRDAALSSDFNAPVAPSSSTTTAAATSIK